MNVQTENRYRLELTFDECQVMVNALLHHMTEILQHPVHSSEFTDRIIISFGNHDAPPWVEKGLHREQTP